MVNEFDDFELGLSMVIDEVEGQLYHISDEIVLKLKDGKIMLRHAKAWDEQATHSIIGGRMDRNETLEYVVFVPHYDYALKDVFTLTVKRCNEYDIADKFVGEKGAFVRVSQIVKLARRWDGAWCRRCSEFVDLAQPNMQDGTFLCYACKANPYR